MNIQDVLEQYKKGAIPLEMAERELQAGRYEDLGYAKIDTERERRVGYPEVIFAQNKEPRHVGEIFSVLAKKNGCVLATRAGADAFAEVKKHCPDAQYNEMAKAVYLIREPARKGTGFAAVCTAGTSDIPVAEEAAVTLDVFGCNVKRIYDIGVAGIHRVFANLDEIRKAAVVVVAAGMEGALPGVLSGLVSKPIIGIPTSVGYGTGNGGTAALLTMLNACSPVLTVNIDNGYGAGYEAAQIIRLLNHPFCFVEEEGDES